MKVLTLNINFKGLTPARIQKICELIQKHNPDIVFLQEVPREMIEHFLQMEQYPFHIGTKFQHPYDTLILSRFPCIRYDRFPLPLTQSGRNLLLAQIILPSGKQINVGTFHVESVFNPPESEVLKMDQLRFIFSIILRTPHSIPFIIAGDTNLLDNRESGIDNEQDSPPTFNNKNRFDRFFTNLVVENSAHLIGDASHSDHRALGMSINLPKQ